MISVALGLMAVLALAGREPMSTRPSVWGPPAWRYLYAVEREMAKQKQKLSKDQIDAFVETLPCGECRRNFEKVTWKGSVKQMHLDVNAKLGKGVKPAPEVLLSSGVYLKQYAYHAPAFKGL